MTVEIFQIFVASSLAGEDDGRLYLRQLSQTVVLVLTKTRQRLHLSLSLSEPGM